MKAGDPKTSSAAAGGAAATGTGASATTSAAAAGGGSTTQQPSAPGAAGGGATGAGTKAAAGAGGGSAAASGGGAATPAKPKAKSKAKTTKSKPKATKASGAAGTQAKAKKGGGGSAAAKKRKAAAGGGAGGGGASAAGGATSKASASALSAANQALWNDARAAAQEMAQHRTQKNARRSDPLWYRIEDIVPAVQDSTSTMIGAYVAATLANQQQQPTASGGGAGTGGGAGSAPGAGVASSGAAAAGASSGILPEQVQIVDNALRYNGLNRYDVTPQAMACLLEQARRYAHEIMTDALDYAYTSNRADLTKEDLLLSYEMRPDHPVSFSTQLPKLNLLAQQVNRSPLPPIPGQCYSGVLLPPKKHQLTARTYDIISGALVAQKMVHKKPEAPNAGGNAKSSNATSGTNKRKASSHPAYGASRGRQISVKLKDQKEKQQESKDGGGKKD